MKRILSLLIAFVLIVLALPFTGYAAVDDIKNSSIKSFSIVADENYTNKFSTSNKKAVAALETALKNAEDKKTTENSTETAKLILTLENGLKVNYSLYAEDSLVYVVSKSDSVAIKKDDWQSFTKAMGISMYKYSAIPTLTLGEQLLTTNESDYAYRKIDNLFYIPKFYSILSLPVIDLSSNRPSVAFSLAPSSTSVTLMLEDKNIDFDSIEEFLKYSPKIKSDYPAEISTTFKSQFYKGTVKYTVLASYGATTETEKGIISNSSDNVGFSVTGSSTYPGEFVVIRISGVSDSKTIKYSGNLSAEPGFFKESDGNYISLLPINYRLDLGEYILSLSADGKSKQFKILINDKKFQVQYLTADGTVTSNTLTSEKANNEFEKYIAPIRYSTANKAYWKDGGFAWPTISGKITTDFGMIRYVNGAPTTYRHGALDIALPKGTRVGATANGKVLYSGFLQLTGNTVVIEHGYGLKSWYYHMNSLNVSTNDSVKIGQKIGEVGTTGFSTGNHLHFGFSVNNVFINPNTVINSDLLN